MILMAGATASDVLVHAPLAVLLVRDEGLRETVATILGELSGVMLNVVDTVDEARRALDEAPDAVLVVAPAWGDAQVARLLRDLRSTSRPTVLVSPSPDHPAMAVAQAIFVRAPFDVDVLLDAIEEALGGRRHSCVQRIN